VIEQDREQQAEDELADDRGPDDKYDRVEDDGGEVGVAEETLVVVEPDEPRSCRVEADERLVREARVERPDRRTDEEQCEEQRGRREAREVRAVPPERDGRGRRAGAQRPRSDRCCYSSSPRNCTYKCRRVKRVGISIA
jgi:hypothetical protein